MAREIRVGLQVHQPKEEHMGPEGGPVGVQGLFRVQHRAPTAGNNWCHCESELMHGMAHHPDVVRTKGMPTHLTWWRQGHSILQRRAVVPKGSCMPPRSCSTG